MKIELTETEIKSIILDHINNMFPETEALFNLVQIQPSYSHITSVTVSFVEVADDQA